MQELTARPLAHSVHAPVQFIENWACLAAGWKLTRTLRPSHAAVCCTRTRTQERTRLFMGRYDMEAQYTFAWFKFTEDMVCVGLRRVCLFLWVPQAGVA